MNSRVLMNHETKVRKVPAMECCGIRCDFVVLFAILFNLTFASAEEVKSKPDPAAHTVIVPYDARKPLDASKTDRFYLDYADFQRLWALAKENRKPEKAVEESGKPEASIASALYDAEVLETGLRVKARFGVVTRGEKWSKLALPFKSGSGTLAVSAIFLDGHPAAFQN